MRKGARNGCEMAAPLRTGCSGSGFILPSLGRVGSSLSGSRGRSGQGSIPSIIGQTTVQQQSHFDTGLLAGRFVLLLLGIGLGHLGSKGFELRVNLSIRQGYTGGCAMISELAIILGLTTELRGSGPLLLLPPFALL